VSKKITISIIIAVVVLALVGGVSLINRGEQGGIAETGQTSATKEGTISKKLPPPDVIKADVFAMNTHNWELFLDIRTQKNTPENREGWISLVKRTPRAQANIMQNVISTDLVGIKPIPFELAGPSRQVRNFQNIKAYYVGINFQVNEETQCTRNRHIGQIDESRCVTIAFKNIFLISRR
jgi:hypothetical protein